MNPFLGYFIFVNLGDGCLGSKYGNTFNVDLFSESATLIRELDKEDSFMGEYVTTWIDSITPVAHTQARLIITRKNRSNSQYNLIWRREGNSTDILYYGEGMIYNENLIGAYWNEPIQNVLMA